MLDFRRVVWGVIVGGITGSAIALLPVSGMTQSVQAQRPSVVPGNLAQPGNQLSLNGRTFTASWLQWQTANGNRIGISDTALLRLVGLQLLNTESPSVQPVQWFSPGNQSLNLPTRLTATNRYLDLTDFARQFGWQLAIAGSTLQINTVPSRVVGLRQSQQAWGDRLVIELDQPTPWQTTQQGQELQMTFNAAIDPAIAQQFKPRTGRFLSSVIVEPVANQTRLRIGTSGTSARVWSLSAPNRIVIDLRPDALVEQNILWAPGLRWRQQLVPVGSTQIPTVWLEVNPRQPGITVQPIVPNPTMMIGTAPLLQTARQAQVAGAINGGFFNRNRQLPLGAVRANGRWLSGPILNRGAIAWDNAGNAVFSRFTLQETVITPTQRLPLTHLNSGYVQAGIARYTPDWGPTYTALSDSEIVVFVQNNQVVSQQVIEKAGTQPAPIPPNGYLLVLRSNRSAAGAFAPGSRLQVETTSNPPDFLRFPHVLGAGPLLIQNQQIVLDAKAESLSSAFSIEQAPRSAIAQRADGTLLFVTAHQKLDGSSLSLFEMAQLLQPLGAINALNLDGGSSTTLFLGGQIIDRDPRTAARVHNAIGIFLRESP
jgi:hypothetical protein